MGELLGESTEVSSTDDISKVIVGVPSVSQYHQLNNFPFEND